MEILANELRIGNWVQRPESVRIDILDGGKIYWLVDSLMIRDCEYYKDNWAFEPIPLTPEILEKCGFEKKQWTTKGIEITCHYYQLNNIVVYLLKGFFEIELITKAGQFNMSKSWNYLHQLQNLYWCLCGKELIFKP